MSAFLDESVKNVTTALKQRGYWDKLLLVFFSDNGGAHPLPWSALFHLTMRRWTQALYTQEARQRIIPKGGGR